MSITGSCCNLKYSIVKGQKGHIEGAATKIEHDDVLLSITLINAVGNGCCSWLIDNPQNVKSGDETSILGSLSLSIIEVSRHSNYCMLNIATEIGLSDLLHFNKNH